MKQRDEHLRVELERMYETDQSVRKTAMEIAKQHGPSSPEYQAIRKRGLEMDQEHISRLVAILEDRGWPSRSSVGELACNAAFLVLQHAELGIQKKYISLLRAATAAGEVPTTQLPLLEDRIRVGDGKPQVYGSQLTRRADGKAELWPIEDPDGVDARRAQVGLEPLAEYLMRFGIGGQRR